MWQEWAFYWLSPFTLAMLGWLAAGALFFMKRQRAAAWVASIAFVGLWLGSTPAIAELSLDLLEGQYPALTPEATPAADAIVLLGGALVGARPPQRPTFTLGPASSRIWHAAALYRAGKAKWIIVAAGNVPRFRDHQAEADAIADILVDLRVPPEAIIRETTSRNTRENARNTWPLTQKLGVNRVLLVTSAQHMRRALQTFVTVWGEGAPELIPAVTDVRGGSEDSSALKLWLPSLDALITVTKSLKEFAGLAALAIIGDTA